MDEPTFRRLAADAVAGRLDPATYERWKHAAAEDPERASFVVRVAEADARLSARYGESRAARHNAAPRVPKRKALAMSALIAVAGLSAGALVMHSYLRAEDAREGRSANSVAAEIPTDNAPKSEPSNQPAANSPRANQPELQPEPEPEPEPEPLPLPEAQGMTIVSASGTVSVRGPVDSQWHKLAAGDVMPAGSTVSVQGSSRLKSDSVELAATGDLQFELGPVIRFIDGRASVRVHSEQSFKCYKHEWSLAQGSFIVAPARLGGELFLLDSEAQCVQLDGTGAKRVLAAAEIRALELELIGPHRTLLAWDCETPATTPALGEATQPGALGDGSAVRRKPGQPGIGVNPSTEVFKAESSGRLRLRVKTTAARVRIEMRARLDDGYRVVDVQVPVQGEHWQTLDVPLDILRAGRQRDEPGWLPGRVYSALLIAPCVNPAKPLERHELQLDDLLVYVPN